MAKQIKIWHLKLKKDILFKEMAIQSNKWQK